MKKNIETNELFKVYISKLKNEVKSSTISTYTALYNKHIDNAFGNFKVNKITNRLLNEYIDFKLQCLSRKYVNDILVFFLGMLNFAIKENYNIQNSFNIKNIRPITKKVGVFTVNEQNKLESFVLKNVTPVTVSIILSLLTGLRLGEICSLKINDFNLKNGNVNISKTLQRIKNLDHLATAKTKIIIDTPKTDKSIRYVPLPSFLIEILKSMFDNMDNQAYFLTGQTDKFIEPRALEYKYKQMLKMCDVAYKNFHVLRHTFATNSIRNNYFDIKTLSEILGHSSTKITLEKYVHSDEETKQNQMQILNNAFLNRHNVENNAC